MDGALYSNNESGAIVTWSFNSYLLRSWAITASADRLQRPYRRTGLELVVRPGLSETDDVVSSNGLCTWYKSVINHAADAAVAQTLSCCGIHICAKGLIGFTTCDIICQSVVSTPTSTVLGGDAKNCRKGADQRNIIRSPSFNGCWNTVQEISSFLANVNSRSRSLYVIVRPYVVCLSVCRL